MTALAVSDLVKSFHEPGKRREVLRGACLTVDPGELVALVGRGGSGKSTLLNLIAGYAGGTRGSGTPPAIR